MRIIHRGLAVLVVMAVLVFMNAPVPTAQAAAVTSLRDTLSRLKASTAANHTIELVTPTGVEASTDTITLTFASGWTLAAEAAVNFDLAVGDSGTCSTATFTDKTLALTAAAATWGVDVTGQVITFTAPTDAASGEITAGRCVQIQAGSNATTGGTGSASTITNPTAGQTTMTIGGTFGDSGTLAVRIIADEQVSVTATVDPTLTFTVDDNAIGFGSLSASTGRWATGDTTGGNASAGSTPTAAHTMTVATNAQSGYAITYNGATLTSGANTVTVATISSDSDGTPGGEQFALSASTSGDATIASGYARGANSSWNFVASTTTTLVSETGETDTETISVSYLGNISTITEAGSYTTTITYIATAVF
ncbi:MAG: hypothetical protein HY567_03780 [Candidatus Kerfeldbacteria bacterium]|nr:hypothetical protein [Candidatus Kerfeldbacteria bacterium]